LRTESKALAAIEELEREHPEIKEQGGIHLLRLDLTDLESCQSAAREFLTKEGRLDVLINNAGVMAAPYELTKDGFELQFQSNHLGHFAFTIPLIPLLVKTSKEPKSSVRIVQLSSMGHKFTTSSMTYDSVESVNRNYMTTWQRYGQSKLANILFAKELARRLAGERIFSNVVHPGGVDTELTRNLEKSWWFVRITKPLARYLLITPCQGAITTLFTATAKEIEDNNWRGEYFVPYAQRSKPSSLGEDAQLARNLWDLSENIIKEKTGYEQTV